MAHRGEKNETNNIHTRCQLCEHHQYQCSCCVQTHTHREKCSVHRGLCHTPSEVWSACRVQRHSLWTIVLALASAGQLGSASSHTIYRSVSDEEVNQRRELETIQSCELHCKRGGDEPLVAAWCVHVGFSSGFLSQCACFFMQQSSEKHESGVGSVRYFLRCMPDSVVIYITLFPSSS